jgi:hypothetical protein
MHLKSLSPAEREEFKNFCDRKIAKLPSPPVLPGKWISKNADELIGEFEDIKRRREENQRLTQQSESPQNSYRFQGQTPEETLAEQRRKEKEAKENRATKEQIRAIKERLFNRRDREDREQRERETQINAERNRQLAALRGFEQEASDRQQSQQLTVGEILENGLIRLPDGEVF